MLHQDSLKKERKKNWSKSLLILKRSAFPNFWRLQRYILCLLIISPPREFFFWLYSPKRCIFIVFIPFFNVIFLLFSFPFFVFFPNSSFLFFPPADHSPPGPPYHSFLHNIYPLAGQKIRFSSVLIFCNFLKAGQWSPRPPLRHTPPRHRCPSITVDHAPMGTILLIHVFQEKNCKKMYSLLKGG